MANRKRIAAAISLVLVVAFVMTMTACGGGGAGGATSVVNALFDSIDKHDAKKFLNCFEKEDREEILDYIDEDELEEELELIDEMFEEFIGRNWRKKVKVGKAEEIDKDKNVTYYEVEVDVDGDESYLEVKKVKGKFYISDDASLSSVFW
ncbi:MAG: hypothetical protein GX027_02955 [Clostridiaceae bacterium]|nr:hypothetical protein [Clostridiaceae bacterium]